MSIQLDNGLYNIAVFVDDCVTVERFVALLYNRRVDSIHVIYIYVMRRKVYAVVKIIKNGIALFN